MNIENKLSSTTTVLFRKPKAMGILVFILLTAIILFVANQRYRLVQEDKRLEMSRILSTVKHNIDQSLKNSYTAALTLGLTINGDGVPKNFETVAAQLINSNRTLSSVQLVPDGVIKYIYPLKGNEKALGVDIFKLSKVVSLEAEKAIELRKMYFAGPIELQQGGMGIVGRMPLFFDNKFWGFSATVIKLDVFLKQAGLYDQMNNKFHFQLSKVNPVTGKEEFFLPVFPDYTTSSQETIDFPDGDWKLYVLASDAYKPHLKIIFPTIFSVLLAALTGFLVYLVFKKPAELQILVHDQASRLLENEIKFKTIFDQAAIGIMEVDSNTGTFLRINGKLCRILGYSEAELRQTTFQALTHPDDLKEDLRYFQQMRAGLIREFELLKRYYRKDGQVVWVNLMITPLWKPGTPPTSHITVVEDVTARVEAEQVAEEYQHRLESLINTIDGIVWEANPQTFDFSFISKKTEDILGYTAEEWLSSPTFWADHVHPDDRDWAIDYCVVCTRKLEQHDFEYRMMAKDGTIVWLRDIVNVIAEEGRAVLLRGIMIDITKQKQAERDLNHSFDLVTEQNKRLLNFSYIVSHNLRSHTSNIQSISTLIDTTNSDEERDEMIGLLKTVSDALNETLVNLNEVVNIQTNINIIVEPLNLSRYIEKTLNVLHDQIVLKHVVIVNKVTEDVLVNYNPAYLESILLNFIFNAIRYSDENRTPLIELSCHREDMMVLQISDNGIGMNLEKYGDELYGMYKTFNGNPDSKGVGLFISKNQIDAMGGKVSVESEVGVGTTFKIYFK
ncbi:PAS domain S-box protein [Pedobacter caeni]|nr:PAS domain S-box protein [Pedobacter caeni]